jgi:hypothetical protein
MQQLVYVFDDDVSRQEDDCVYDLLDDLRVCMSRRSRSMLAGPDLSTILCCRSSRLSVMVCIARTEDASIDAGRDRGMSHS